MFVRLKCQEGKSCVNQNYRIFSAASDDTQDTTIDRNGQGVLLQVPVNQYMFHSLKRWQQRQLAKAMT